MGVVGSLPLFNENNNETNPADQPISSAHLCMKELQMVAMKLEKRQCEEKKSLRREFRCEKQRQTRRKLKLHNEHIRERLRKQVQELESRQNHLLSTVNQLRVYKQELEVVYQRKNSFEELIA